MQGGKGEVSFHRYQGKEVVIKWMQNKGEIPITELNRECNFLSRCTHQNIVAFQGICYEPPPADVRGVVLEACKVCQSVG